MGAAREHPALRSPDRPWFARAMAALGRAAERASDAIGEAYGLDPRSPEGRP